MLKIKEILLTNYLGKKAVNMKEGRELFQKIIKQFPSTAFILPSLFVALVWGILFSFTFFSTFLILLVGLLYKYTKNIILLAFRRYKYGRVFSETR